MGQGRFEKFTPKDEGDNVGVANVKVERGEVKEVLVNGGPEFKDNPDDSILDGDYPSSHDEIMQKHFDKISKDKAKTSEKKNNHDTYRHWKYSFHTSPITDKEHHPDRDDNKPKKFDYSRNYN
jgi:hypothetical protein